MHKVQVLLVAFLLVMPAFGTPIGSNKDKASVSWEVRKTARKLAHAWVDTASASTLDQLANRSTAFAGMVPGLFVTLDGHHMSTTQALKDSALTILKQSITEADAGAIRNTVYTLMEIANGQATRQ